MRDRESDRTTLHHRHRWIAGESNFRLRVEQLESRTLLSATPMTLHFSESRGEVHVHDLHVPPKNSAHNIGHLTPQATTERSSLETQSCSLMESSNRFSKRLSSPTTCELLPSSANHKPSRCRSRSAPSSRSRTSSPRFLVATVRVLRFRPSLSFQYCNRCQRF